MYTTHVSYEQTALGDSQISVEIIELDNFLRVTKFVYIILLKKGLTDLALISKNILSTCLIILIL